MAYRRAERRYGLPSFPGRGIEVRGQSCEILPKGPPREPPPLTRTLFPKGSGLQSGCALHMCRRHRVTADAKLSRPQAKASA
jgi:hypothetical protein